MLIALAACLVPPLVHLNRHKSEDRVSRPTTLVLLFVMVAGLEVGDIVNIFLMTIQPWYTGGNGTAANVSCCCCDALKCKQSMVGLVQHMSGAVELCCTLCTLHAKCQSRRADVAALLRFAPVEHLCHCTNAQMDLLMLAC